MSLDLKSLELFVRVATVGAIGKAGAEFGLSPTAATQRIQALEKDVGAQLLHRSTRAVALSADGELFLDHAKRIIANVEDALADVQCDPQSIQGELRVAGSASFGRIHLAPYIAEFMDEHPNVSIQLHLTDAVVDIIEDGFDLAIRLGELAPSALKARRIGDSARILVAAPSYIEQRGLPENPEALKLHHCLTRGDIRTWALRSPDGTRVDAKVYGRFTTNHAEAVTEAAVSGLGIARKCKWEIAGQLASGALVQILGDHLVVPEWSVFAVRPPSRMQPARVRAFTDFLERKFRSIPSLN